MRARQIAVAAPKPELRRVIAPSAQEHSAVCKFHEPEIGRDTSAYNHNGTVVVASAWLAFYVIAAIYVMTSGN
jgi:hypothetical protein